MTKASHRIKGPFIVWSAEGGGGVVWSRFRGLRFSQENSQGGRSERSNRDKWRKHLGNIRLFILSLPLPTPLPLSPSSCPPCGPSSGSCHYRRAPVNQSVLIQWHVGRGHVTYVKRREWGDLQGVLVCEQVCAGRSVCVCVYVIAWL